MLEVIPKKPGWFEDIWTGTWHIWDSTKENFLELPLYSCGTTAYIFRKYGSPKPGKGRVCRNCLRIEAARKKKGGG
jgi:hypothetical protein